MFHEIWKQLGKVKRFNLLPTPSAMLHTALMIMHAIVLMHLVVHVRWHCFMVRLSLSATCRGSEVWKNKQGKQNKLHIDFFVCRSSQYRSLISLMEYLSVKSTGKRIFANGNWMHKTFCYFLVFVYRDKWSRILRRCGGNPYSAPCGSCHLEGKLRDSVLVGPLWDSFICHIFLLSIPLSASGMFMNISTKWYESNNTSQDPGYFTKKSIRCVSWNCISLTLQLFNIVCISQRCSCVCRGRDSWVLHMAVYDLSLVRCAA